MMATFGVLKLRKNCQLSHQQFRKVSLSNASSSDRNAGYIAWTQKRTSLKLATMASNNGKHTDHITANEMQLFYVVYLVLKALHVSDALCVHHQEHYKLLLQPLVFVMIWDGINPVMDVTDGRHCNIPWPRCGGSLGGVRCAL